MVYFPADGDLSLDGDPLTLLGSLVDRSTGKEKAMRSTHIRLLVDDYAGMLGFYSKVMGFPVRLEAPPDDPDYAEFETEPAVLSIYLRGLMNDAVGGGVMSGAGDASVLIFAVDDVDEEVRRLTDLGVEMVSEPQDQEAWGLRVAHLRDPEENLIELNKPLEISG
jgi:predicted enzyme related to lactoylglutathione lyase